MRAHFLIRAYKGSKEKTMAQKKTFVFDHPETGDVCEVSFPCNNIVCPECAGEGKYVNPAVDGNGISGEEFYSEWSEEDRENYMSGVYDVVCKECKGNKVIPEIDEENLSEEEEKDLKLFRQWQKEEEDYQRMCADERRFGA